MWTRRMLLAMMVAAAAVSLPRHVPASWNVSLGPTDLAYGSAR